jgi:hypothetical protein
MSLIMSCPSRPTADELSAGGTVPLEPIGKVYSPGDSCIAYFKSEKMSP